MVLGELGPLKLKTFEVLVSSFGDSRLTTKGFVNKVVTMHRVLTLRMEFQLNLWRGRQTLQQIKTYVFHELM